MPGRPRLILHIGHPKCASTTVRSLLWNNRARLAEAGCYFVGDDFRIAPGNDIAGWPLWFIEKAAGPAELSEALLNKLAELDSVKTLVVSAENLIHPATAAKLDRLVSSLETSVIYYMRRQDHFLVSSWRQWALKRGTGFMHHVLRRVAERKPDFAGTLALWEHRVGRDNIHARFIDPLFLDGGNLPADLFAALGMDIPDPVPADRDNTSPDRAILIYLQANAHLFASDHDDEPIRRMAILDEGPVRRLTMDRHLQKSVILAYEKTNQAILATYGRKEDHGKQVIMAEGEAAAGEYQLTLEDQIRIGRILAKLDHGRSHETGDGG